MNKTRLAIVIAVFLCVLSTAIPLEASTWTIPGIANISGREFEEL